MNSETTSQVIDAVVRASDVFLAALHQRDVGVSSLSRELGLPKATVGRILHSLRIGGLVEQDGASGRYRVSSKVTSLLLGHDYMEFSDLALPYLEKIRDAINETVGLFVRVGYRRMCIVQVESKESLRRVLTVGEQKPIDTGTTSRVLLASMTPVERARLWAVQPPQRLTPESLTDTERLEEVCKDALRQGYSYTANQTVLGVAGYSVPVLDTQGRLRGVISISGPEFRFTNEIAERNLPMLQQAARKLGQQLR